LTTLRVDDAPASWHRDGSMNDDDDDPRERA
jgi:hypothetical protein